MTTRTITAEALAAALRTQKHMYVDGVEPFAAAIFAALPAFGYRGTGANRNNPRHEAAEPAGATGLRAALETLANDNEYDGPVFGATVRRIARAALAVTPVGEGPVLDVERLARALEAADKVIVDNDYGIVTDTGDIEEVAAAYAAVPDGEGEG